MDKKEKKRLEVLRQKLQTLKQQLAGARRQSDEPGEAEKLEEQISAIEREIERIKSG
jgi:hypothetical protein